MRHCTASAPCPGAGSMTSSGSHSVTSDFQSQPSQPCASENDRVILAIECFAQPRVHIAAQGFGGEGQGGAKGSGQRGAGLKSRRRTERKCVDSVPFGRDQCVTHFGTCGNTSNGQSYWIFNRQIFQRMNRTMDSSAQQFRFEFLREQTLAADFRQRLVENIVTLRGNDFFFTLQTGMDRFSRPRLHIGFASGQVWMDVLRKPVSLFL